MNIMRSKYYMLVLLAFLFAAPGIAAYLFYQHPGWLGSSLVNRGTFINPPVELNIDQDTSKWRIVFWSPGNCDQSCWKQIDILARVRLALGRKLYDVDQWLVFGNQALPLTEELQSILKDRDFKVAKLSTAQTNELASLSEGPKVFIANPDHYLILSYQSEVNPNDIYKDLKLLLNTTTHNKNG